MEALSEVLTTADVLYGLLPEAFTAARDERVRTLRRGGSSARALAIKDLRRPSVAAWLVNAMVRHRRGEVEQLLRVGAALREAQNSLDAGQLRELNRQRQVVLTAVVRDARVLASELGRPVSEPVLLEVEETLRAALADPTTANAVRSGRLTTSLRYAGFGDCSDGPPVTSREAARRDGPLSLRSSSPPRAIAAPRVPPGIHGVHESRPRPAPGPGAGLDRGRPPARPTAADETALREAALALQAAEDAAQRSEGTALAAEQHRDSLRRRARTAQERLELAHAQVAELESRLAVARTATSTAAAAWAPLHAEADAAAARAEAARGIAESSRVILESARAHLAGVRRRVPGASGPG